MLELNCVLSPGAKLPNRNQDVEAGIDLYAYILESNKPSSITILPNQVVTINTGVIVKISQGFAGLVFNTDQQASRGIQLIQGVGLISSNYRQPIQVSVKNVSDKAHVIYWGDIVAKLVIQTAFLPKIILAKD